MAVRLKAVMGQLQRSRERAAMWQDQACFYCHRPMWDGDPETLGAFCTDQGLTKRQAKLRRCTAEHLVADAEGGTRRIANIAAACLFCNRQRHRPKRVLDPAQFRLRVLNRLHAGKWSN